MIAGHDLGSGSNWTLVPSLFEIWALVQHRHIFDLHGPEDAATQSSSCSHRRRPIWKQVKCDRYNQVEKAVRQGYGNSRAKDQGVLSSETLFIEIEINQCISALVYGCCTGIANHATSPYYIQHPANNGRYYLLYASRHPFVVHLLSN